jgi:hypothetical protein
MARPGLGGDVVVAAHSLAAAVESPAVYVRRSRAARDFFSLDFGGGVCMVAYADELEPALLRALRPRGRTGSSSSRSRHLGELLRRASAGNGLQVLDATPASCTLGVYVCTAGARAAGSVAPGMRWACARELRGREGCARVVRL